MGGLDGKTVLVTGGGGGIGGATCRRFGAAGAKVAVLDLNPTAASATAEAITAAGGRAIAIKCDITRREDVDAAVAKCHGRISVPSTCWSTTPAGMCSSRSRRPNASDWERLIAINLIGALNMHHAVLPGMVEPRRADGSSTSPPTPRASAPRAKPSMPPARAASSRSRKQSPASMPVTASPSTSSAPAQPTRHSSPTTSRARATPTSSKTRSVARSRSAASASPTICRAPSCSSPATMPATSPARC